MSKVSAGRSCGSSAISPMDSKTGLKPAISATMNRIAERIMNSIFILLSHIIHNVMAKIIKRLMAIHASQIFPENRYSQSHIDNIRKYNIREYQITGG